VVLLGAAFGASWWLGRDRALRSSPARQDTAGQSVPQQAATAPTDAAPVADPNADLPQWLAAQTNVLEILNLGNNMLSQGSSELAIQCYERALILKPRDEEIHYNMGVAYGRMNRLEDAERHYRQALEFFPDYAEAMNNLGNVLTRQKRYEEAVALFEAAIKLAPDDALAHNNLGRALAEQGKAELALQRFDEAARLDTNYVEARFNVGASHLTLGRTNEAISHFEAALRMSPEFMPAARMLNRLRSSQ
jgi:tetratricopeptide (TPR) repeat protein